ncbi:hypothetical protein B0T10DRAFT_370904, partial [Thelonectria olida]
LQSCIPLDDGPLAVSALPTQPPGAIRHLPPEITGEILLGLDIPILMKFRCTNRQATRAVDSLVIYQVLKKYLPDVLRTILLIHADKFDLRQLGKTIQRSRCSECKGFGSHLDLSTCHHICHKCFDNRPEFLLIDSTVMIKRTKGPNN